MMRRSALWVMAMVLAGCDAEQSSFGRGDANAVDLGELDRGAADAMPQRIDSGLADAALVDAMPTAPDVALPDAALPDAMTVDALPADASLADALTDSGMPDAAVDQSVDAAVDMAVDATPDMLADAAEPAGPLCGDARRLPLDGDFTRVGPVDRAAYLGCDQPGDAWSAFIELDEARLVEIKPGVGRVQRGDTCEAGQGECAVGARRFELPAGRTRFVFIDTDTVRVRSTPNCSDGADNDDDGRVDMNDPGCARADDWTEIERPGVTPACANGRDDDGDGRADWPFDMRCLRPGSALEACREAPRGTLTSTTPETVLLGAIGGLPAALECAAPADAIEVMLVAPWSGRARIEVDAVGAQAMEIRRGCDGVEQCSVEHFDTYLPVAGGEILRVRIQGRPLWLRWQISAPTDCANGLDDDGDGRIDLQDDGCRDLDDPTEADPNGRPACSNGLDDDRDRGSDYPEDFACRGPGGTTEVEACAVADFRRTARPNGWTRRRFVEGSCGGDDTDEVGLSLTLDRPSRIRMLNGVGYLRSDCADPDSELGCVDGTSILGPAFGSLTLYVESGAALAEPAIVPQRRCGNGVDDDADDLVDTADPGCTDRFDDDERDPPAPAPAECGDGADNDGDGLIDWPDDGECLGVGDASELGRCVGAPDIAPVDRFVVLDDFDHLPVTHSFADGRPVYALIVPFAIDRPAIRQFPADESINWVRLVDCAPADMLPFGSARQIIAERGELLMRLEVDIDAVDPFVDLGGLVPDCRNGVDDDGDGLIDGDDPGCARQALTEHDDDDLPECADGVDNDGDGRIDGDDLECLGAADVFEGGTCVSDTTVAGVTETTTRWVVPVEAPRFGLGCGPETLPASIVVPIEVPDGGRLSVQTIEGTGDPVLSLEQSCDAPIACVDDSQGLQASMVEDLAPGRYALRVGRWDASDRSPIHIAITIE